jgi:hypothetical protein
MKNWAIVISFFLLGCGKNYHYNVCDFYTQNIVVDSSYNNIPYNITLSDLEFNNLNEKNDSAFYGVFRGTYNNKVYNILAFNTSIASDRLIGINNSGMLSLRLRRDLKCFNFSSSINIEGFLNNKQESVIVGELHEILVDPH